jgi:hypothetical protein
MRLIYEGFENEMLEKCINDSPAKKLIHELNFKYGLKVVDKVDPHSLSRSSPISFLLADPNGFMVAKVWTDKECDDVVYNYRSPFYRKERGSDSADRETLHSKKLSTLMATFSSGGQFSAVGNVVGSNFTTTGLISASGNITSGNISSGNISATNHIGTNVSVTGVVTAA